MKAMKHAFAEALEANMHLTLCDYCPIHYLHKICEKLEGKSLFKVMQELCNHFNSVFLSHMYYVL